MTKGRRGGGRNRECRAWSREERRKNEEKVGKEEEKEAESPDSMVFLFSFASRLERRHAFSIVSIGLRNGISLVNRFGGFLKLPVSIGNLHRGIPGSRNRQTHIAARQVSARECTLKFLLPCVRADVRAITGFERTEGMVSQAPSVTVR